MTNNDFVFPVTILFLFIWGVNFAEPKELAKMLKITTPDTNEFVVQIVEKDSVKKLVSSNDFILVDSPNPAYTAYKLYTTKNKREYLLQKKDGSALHFPSSQDFETYLGGETYWSTSVFTKNENCYISFSLNPNKVIRFKSKISKELKQYKPFDGYTAFLLTTGSIIFIRQRTNDLYDGYWYPSLKDFEFSYDSFAY